MKKIILFALMLVSALARGQAYERTRMDQVLSDRATQSLNFMLPPRGATPSFPSYVPNNLKDGALFYKTAPADTALMQYSSACACWVPISKLKFEGSTDFDNYLVARNSDGKLTLLNVAYSASTNVLNFNTQTKFTGTMTALLGLGTRAYGVAIDAGSHLIKDTTSILYKFGGNQVYGNQTFYNKVYLHGDAVDALEPITKNQFDNYVTGITWKQEVRAATTANITLSGTQTVDGVSLVANDRVLVKSQTNQIQNGIYLVKSTAWTRAVDADDPIEIASAAVLVRLGTVNKNTQWTCTNITDPVMGTDPITFAQLSGAGTYTNGTGLTLTANVFDVNYTTLDNRYSKLSGTNIFYGDETFNGSLAITGNGLNVSSGLINFDSPNYMTFSVKGVRKMLIADGDNSDSRLDGIWYINTAPTIGPSVANKTYVDGAVTTIGDVRYGLLSGANNWTNSNYSTGGWYGQNFVSTSYGGSIVPGDASFGFSVSASSQFNTAQKGFYIKTNGVTDWFAGEISGGPYVLSKWNTTTSAFDNIFTAQSGQLIVNSDLYLNSTLKFFGAGPSSSYIQQGNAEMFFVLDGGTTKQSIYGNRWNYVDNAGTRFPYALSAEVAGVNTVYTKTQSDARYVDLTSAQTVGGSKTWNGAQTISRAVVDATTVLTVNNQSGTGSIQSWQAAGTEVARLQTNGYLYGKGVIDVGGSSNGFFGVGTATAGNSITRNIADGAATLTVNNVNTSSTGVLITAQVNGVNRFIVAGNGAVNLTDVYAAGRVGIGISSSAGALIHMNPTTFLTSGSFGINGFGINQNAVTYTANGTSGTIAATYINSYATPTLATSTASTLTKVYNSYFVAPLAGTNVTIGTSYGLGTNGNFEMASSVAATSGAPVQNSPSLSLQGNVWNTSGTPQTNTALWQATVIPISGTSPSSVLNLNATMQGVASKTVFQLTSDGNINATGQIGVSRSNLATTPSIAFNAFNNTAATVGVPVQMSPNYTMLGTAWNTTSSASDLKFLTMDLLPVSGAATSANWRLGFSTGGSYNYPFTVSNTGDITTTAINNYSTGNFSYVARNATTGRFELAPDMTAFNATTVGLSSATLNSTYPTAPNGFRVICGNITMGGAIYTKYSSSVWLMTSAPVQM